MNDYVPTIGLEIHAELKTRTKMFCNSKNDPDEKKPNVNICPICMGHPGTLPTINKEALGYIVRIGTALGGRIADSTEFERKNYFYPDIPKGYQISQYRIPIVSGGTLNNVQITRVHLEEDTARSTHDVKADESLVDFNRAGIPLMELVTEPIIESARQASGFARELQLLLRYLGVSDANMEKGEMRVEANISVLRSDLAKQRPDLEDLGTKVEVKNLNSFRIVEKAIEYEVKRQTGLLEDGGEVVQETRGWDEKRNITFSQREKESSHDYRYFSEPDLPKLRLSQISEFKDIKLPELPWEKRERFRKEYGVKDEDLEMYIRDSMLSSYAEAVFKKLNNDKKAIKLASNYITSDVVGLRLEIPGSMEYFEKLSNAFASLILMAQEAEISSSSVTRIIPIIWEKGRDPLEVAKELGLLQKSDEGELDGVVENVIRENQAAVLEYKGGKDTALKFLIGQGMKESKGSANPQTLEKLFKSKIK